MKSSRCFTSALILGISGFLFSGCETAPDTERPELVAPFAIKRGTTSEEILTNLGKPNLKHPLAEYSIEAEVWVYNRTMGSSSELIYTGTREQKYWDPFIRRMVVIEVPVYSPEVTSNTETTEILMISDQVYSWKRTNSENRDVDGLTR